MSQKSQLHQFQDEKKYFRKGQTGMEK